MNKIIELIKKSKTIAVLTHISEDADALGSAFAFAEAMKNMGKTADVYISEKPEDRLSFLGNRYIVYDGSQKPAACDLCVCLDSGDLQRLGSRAEIFGSAGHTINIDHHFTNPNYAEENMVVSDASSTGEVLYGLFIGMGVKITKQIAEYLYISIASDTGCFKYSNVSAKTMRIVSELLLKEINHSEICRRLFDTEKREVIKLKGYIMENIHEYFNGRLCIVSADDKIFEKYNVCEKDTGDLVNIPRTVEGCEIASSVRKSGERVKVSFRSNGRYDVSEIAVSFGGGGHKMAAGATFTGVSAEQAEAMIVDACKKLFRETENNDRI